MKHCRFTIGKCPLPPTTHRLHVGVLKTYKGLGPVYADVRLIPPEEGSISLNINDFHVFDILDPCASTDDISNIIASLFYIPFVCLWA